MSSQHVFPHKHLILDACCVINLLASMRAKEIMISLQTHLAIATYVQEQELLSIGGTIQGLGVPKEAIDLAWLEHKGLLTYESPNNEVEQISYINLAAVLGDDGEAITCAIALARGWAIATDDRKPANFLRRHAPQIPLITTLDIIKFWSEQTKSSSDPLPEALRNIRTYGRYTPARSHHLYSWWDAHIGRRHEEGSQV